MYVISEFEDSYHIYKIFVVSLVLQTVIFSALKMFSNYRYEKRCFIKIQIARGKNARQCHTALLEACGRETLPYRTVARQAYVFRSGRKDVHQCHTAIMAVLQSGRRDVQQDAVNGISCLPNVWRRVLHVGGDCFRSLKQCDCSKNVFCVVNSNVATNY